MIKAMPTIGPATAPPIHALLVFGVGVGLDVDSVVNVVLVLDGVGVVVVDAGASVLEVTGLEDVEVVAASSR